MALFHLLDAAKLAPGLPARLRGGQSARQRVALGELEVRGHLVFQLALEPRFTKQRQHTRESATYPHDLASRMRATSAAADSQLATSTRNCFSPLLVSA